MSNVLSARKVDSETHVVLARHLLRVCDLPQTSCRAALYPQLDRQPAYFHRNIAHNLFVLSDVLIASRTKSELSDWKEAPDLQTYYSIRLTHEKARINRWIEKTKSGEEDNRPAERIGDVLGYISHLYNDTFNNPVQAFVPNMPMPSGQWSLFAKRSPGYLRWHLYLKPGVIEDIRLSHFASSEWKNLDFKASALIYAMIRRLAALADHADDNELINAASDALQLSSSEVIHANVQVCEDFLLWHERDLMQRILQATAA